jgi:hypothetical protein
MQMEVTKLGEDRYNVDGNENFTYVEEENIDGPKLMATTGLTASEVFYLFDLKPIGHKETITSK